jgi:hypothetical protein
MTDQTDGPDPDLVRQLNTLLAALQGREPRWRYFQRAGGPICFWTVERYASDAGGELAGRYVSGVYEPVGPGCRSGRARTFRLAGDSLGAHALRRDAKARALRLFRAVQVGERRPWR